MDTWITYIDQEGQRVLLKGMRNLIEDKLAINDLWRVAKDTDYYLGRLFTPVDAFKQILGLDQNSPCTGRLPQHRARHDRPGLNH